MSCESCDIRKKTSKLKMWNSCHKAPWSQAESSENCTNELMLLINHQDLKRNVCTNLYRDPHMTPTHTMHYCIYIYIHGNLFDKNTNHICCIVWSLPNLGPFNDSCLYQSLISLLVFLSDCSLCLETPKLDALVRHKVLKTSRLSVIESTPDLLCVETIGRFHWIINGYMYKYVYYIYI